MSRRREREANIRDHALEKNKSNLISFLRGIPNDKYDNDVAEMMVEHLCDHDEEIDGFTWKTPPDDLSYGIMMAGIEDAGTRNELQRQIESRALDGLLEEINGLKADTAMNHREAFFAVMDRRYPSVPSEEVGGASAAQAGGGRASKAAREK